MDMKPKQTKKERYEILLASIREMELHLNVDPDDLDVIAAFLAAKAKTKRLIKAGLNMDEKLNLGNQNYDGVSRVMIDDTNDDGEYPIKMYTNLPIFKTTPTVHRIDFSYEALDELYGKIWPVLQEAGK